MLLKTKIIYYFSRTKVMFASLAMIMTFCITIYNQFKASRSTEISGIVAASKESNLPVDAIVTISSPVHFQTETDSQGRFKFKLANLQSDTFLLIVQDKRTNITTKQTEYVNASKGRTDIVILSKADLNALSTNNPSTAPTSHSSKRRTSFKKRMQRLFQ